MKQNHYRILEISRYCNTRDMRVAYHSLALQWHPDMNGGARWAVDYFQLVNVDSLAYRIDI
jgi:DnaJ-class molecular chaperone